MKTTQQLASNPEITIKWSDTSLKLYLQVSVLIRWQYRHHATDTNKETRIKQKNCQ